MTTAKVPIEAKRPADTPAKTPAERRNAVKAERLAAKLRENLLRRKQGGPPRGSVDEPEKTGD
jgi:hypothetical protein